MSATYTRSSPYYTSDQASGYLNVWNYRDIPSQTDDIAFTVTKNFEYRPDLLAYSLYEDVNLWWVFAVRNPSVIKDPIYDLTAGTVIYLPKLTTIKTALGL